MEIDQPEQLDALLSQSTKILNTIQEVKETNASIMTRNDKSSPFLLDKKYKQLEKHSPSPDQNGFDPHPVTGIYFLYSSTNILNVPDCLPSGNPIKQVDIITRWLKYMDEIMHDISKCDHNNKLFISLNDKDHDIARDFQDFLNDTDRRWYKVLALYWSYGIHRKSPFFT